MEIALELKVGLALLLGVSLVAAAVVAPPKEPKVSIVGAVLGASLMLYGVAAVLLFSGSSGTGLAALVVASEGMCATAWLGRSFVADQNDDGDGGTKRETLPKSPGDPGGDQVDWPLFESLRRSWSAERASRGSGPESD